MPYTWCSFARRNPIAKLIFVIGSPRSTDVVVTSDSDGISLSEKYKIKDMWIGQKVGLQNVVDKKYGGRIQATSQHVEPFVLVMKFEDERGLDSFYQDEKHSEIRRKIFERLDPRLKQLYSMAPAAAAKKSNELVYEAIEAIASKHIHRRDYLEDEAVEQMVSDYRSVRTNSSWG